MAISFRNDILPLKDRLYRLALRITLNPAEAEDVVQETMIKVWNRRDNWEAIDNMETFCLTICRNLAVDKTRHMGNQTLSFEEIDSSTTVNAHLSTFNSPEEQTIQRDRIQLVRRLISQLPEKQRSCMQLRDFESKSYKDIATILDITEEQVKINIFRARQTIREQFKKADK